MPVYASPYIVSISPWYQRELSDGILYKPQYSLGNSFEESCDAWFNDVSTTRTHYKWTYKSVDGHNWSDLGHDFSSSKIGGSAFCLLSKQNSAATETTVFNSWSNSFSDYVSIDLSMKGAPLAFSVGAGYWYSPLLFSLKEF